MAQTLEDVLTAIHVEMKRRQLPDMDNDTIQELATRVRHPEVLQAMQSGQLTVGRLVDEVQAALQGMAEGGLVNDQRGGGTARIRSQLGIQP